MTDLGKAFAGIAYDVVRLHGVDSNKLVVGYEVFADDNTIRGSEDDVPHLEQLAKLGYLRKWVGKPYKNNKGRNWRYRFWVRGVYFGLTAKGWDVAEQYITAAYGAAEYKRLIDSHVVKEMPIDEWVAGWDEFVTD